MSEPDPEAVVVEEVDVIDGGQAADGSAEPAAGGDGGDGAGGGGEGQVEGEGGAYGGDDMDIPVPVAAAPPPPPVSAPRPPPPRVAAPPPPTAPRPPPAVAAVLSGSSVAPLVVAVRPPPPAPAPRPVIASPPPPTTPTSGAGGSGSFPAVNRPPPPLKPQLSSAALKLTGSSSSNLLAGANTPTNASGSSGAAAMSPTAAGAGGSGGPFPPRTGPVMPAKSPPPPRPSAIPGGAPGLAAALASRSGGAQTPTASAKPVSMFAPPAGGVSAAPRPPTSAPPASAAVGGEADEWEAAINSRNVIPKAPKVDVDDDDAAVVVETVQLPSAGGRTPNAGAAPAYVGSAEAPHSFVELAHQFPLVDRQVRAGHENFKKIATWLKTIFTAIKANADLVLKVTTADSEGQNKLDSDGDCMYEHVGGLRLVANVVTEAFKHTQNWCIKLDAQVIKPMENAYHLGEQARSKISKDDKDQNTTMGNKSVEVEKHKVSCLKLWKELMDLQKERRDEQDKPIAKQKPGAVQKIIDKIQKHKEKSQKAFKQFEELQTKHLESMAEYRTKILPQRLRALEVLEIDRLDTCERLLKQFSVLLKEHALPLPLTASLQKHVAELKTQKSLQRCITTWLKNFGDCPAYVPSFYYLPCTVQELDEKSDGWMNPKPAPTARAALDDGGGGGGGDGDDEEDDDGMDDPLDHKQDLWMRTIVDYDGKIDGHVPFKEGDVVCITESSGPMMWQGYVIGANDKRGMIPKLALEPLTGRTKDKDDKEKDPEESKSLLNSIRGKVSKKKRRFLKDGYDLDLTYITPNIIGMGFPSEGLAGQYRNNMGDVQKFMNTRHPGKFKIYNLCSEREYEPKKFDGRCARFPFDDHNPCPLTMIEPFCIDMHSHLTSGGTEQLAAVHCKAGKGRTGFLIACYLLHSGFSPTASHALRYYAAKRTYNCKGVTIPSQIRYTHYYEQILAMKKAGRELPAKNPLILSLLTIHGIPAAVRDDGVAVWFTVEFPHTKTPKYSSKGILKAERRTALDHMFFQGHSITGIAPVTDDIKISFYHGTLLSQQSMFHFWFNTRMIKGAGENSTAAAAASAGGADDISMGSTKTKLVFKKHELDKAVKDKNHKLYSPSMRVELLFTSF